ncbi:TraC family protein, partial [Vibrio cyclitrophicus]
MFSTSRSGLSALFQEAKQAQNHLHHELPYRDYDPIERVFDNTHSRGFGFKISVLGGANDDLIQSLSHLMGDLPAGDKWDYQVQLFGHNRVAHYLEGNQALLSQRGGICQKLANDDAIYA